MDAENYTKIEQLLMAASLYLYLMVVWVAMQIIKSKARFIYELTMKVYQLQGEK